MSTRPDDGSIQTAASVEGDRAVAGPNGIPAAAALGAPNGIPAGGAALGARNGIGAAPRAARHGVRAAVANTGIVEKRQRAAVMVRPRIVLSEPIRVKLS